MRRRQSRRDRGDSPTATVVWSREKLLALLAGGVAAALLVIAGLVLALVAALRVHAPAGRAAAGPSSRSVTDDARSPATSLAPIVASSPDEIAGAPMPSVPGSASHPSALSRQAPPPPVGLPASTRMGPAGVPTGYPRTTAGALGQLAAIDGTALSSASMTGVRDVIAGWAVPGGPTASSWSVVTAMATLLDATQNTTDTVTASAPGPAGGAQLVVVASPLMGLVKGGVPAAGSAAAGARLEFVVACLDIELDVTVTSTARGAAGDCQRMVWAGGRWMIGAGPEPAAAPSVWPGTDLAYQVGYRDLRYAGIAGPQAPGAPGGDGPNGSLVVSGG